MLEDKKLPHLAIGVGMASGGRLSIINLQKESDGPSILVAGASGRGKSNTLNGIICTLIRRNSPAMLQFYMVDLKHVELSAYESLPHLARPVALEEGEAIGVFDDVMKHMAERQAMFAGRGVRKIATWNEKYPAEALPYLVVIIDELAMLMASRTKLPDGRGVRNEAEYALGKLTAVGRAYGVHCILCTQRPSTDVIIGTIKANVPTRIALGVASPTDSMTIINNGMAAGLDPVGRCILYSGGRYTECQAPLIYDEQIRRTVAFANKYALPKQTATNERLWELIGSGEWGGLPDLYERGVKDTFSLTYSEFVQWYWRWAYSLPDCAPVITLGKEKYILHLTKLLPIGDKPPTSREQLERLEVTR
jgi:S-DNA-T family DNA segregation ATPase FtsK/SpoIIIE